MEKNLVEKIDDINQFVESVKNGKIKPKDLKFPRKVKVKKNKLKKGYVGIIKIDENGVITGEKQQLEEGVFLTKDKNWHAPSKGSLLSLNGKFPVYIQPSWSVNPITLNELKEIKPTNEVYGMKLIFAKMLKAAITNKKKMGSAVIWIGIGIAVIIGYSIITKGGV